VNQGDRKQYTQIVISLAMLYACLRIILGADYDETYAKWAFGLAGVIIGYWLK
jgi:hypothetical protein